MQLKKALDFNTLRFGIAYALGLFVAGVDLSISVRAGEALTGNSLGGTASYVLIALGTIIAARIGAPQLQRFGPRRTFFAAGIICVLSGVSTSYAAYASVPALLYVGMFLIGVFMGLSNFHRLLVKDHSNSPNPWDTSLVLLSGVVGSILGPWAAGNVAGSVAEFSKAYQLVIAVGGLVLLTSLMLPKHSRTSSEHATTASFDDRGLLYLGGIAGMFGYAAMTLMMTAVPLAAQSQGLESQDISRLTEMHMVAMYLPIVMVPPLLSRCSARATATGALGVGAIGGVVVLMIDSQFGKTSLFMLMLIAGVIWAFSYTAASDMVAENQFGKANPAARGRMEMLPPTGMMVGAILAGLLLEYSGFLSVTVAFIAVSVAAVLTLFALSKNSIVVGVNQR